MEKQKWFYSPSLRGFFLEGDDNIPDDVITVTESQRMKALTEQSKGKIISVVDGKIKMVDREYSSEELGSMARGRRDHELSSSDWIVSRSYERGEPVPEAWVEYRQALRDLPSQEGFPSSVQWPKPPQE